jgi:hypothetical protein
MYPVQYTLLEKCLAANAVMFTSQDQYFSVLILRVVTRRIYASKSASNH